MVAPRVAAAILFLLALSSPGQAQNKEWSVPDVAAADGLSVTVRVGYGTATGHGVSKRFGECPVEVALRLDSAGIALRGTLALEAHLPPVQPTFVHDALPLELSPGGAKRVRLSFRIDRTLGVRVVLRDARGQVRFRKQLLYGDALKPLGSGISLYGTLATAGSRGRLYWPAGLARALTDDVQTQHAQVVSVAPEGLDPKALAGLDALLIAEPPGLPAEGAQGVRAWVEEGGLLLLAAGSRGVEWADDSLADLLPVDVLGQASAKDGLASINSARPAGEVTPVLRSRLRAGSRVVFAARADLPLVTVRRIGRGQVAFLSFPIDSPAFLDDAVRTRVVRAALPLPAKPGPDYLPRDALEEAVGEELWWDARDAASAWWILYLVLGFFLLVGPLDYLVWRRWPKPKVTWTLFLINSLGFSALAFALGRSGGPESLQVHTAVVVDAVGEEGVAVEGLVGFAAKRLERYRLEVASGLRFLPALCTERDHDPQGLAGALLVGPRLDLELGLATGLLLRVRGRARARVPLQARLLPGGAVEVVNTGGRRLELFVARRGTEPSARRLEPGETARFEPFPLESGARPDWSQLDGSVLARASLARVIGTDVAERFGLPGRVDLSSAYLHGATLVMAAEEAPFALLDLQREGKPLAQRGRTLYRRVLLPRGDE